MKKYNTTSQKRDIYLGIICLLAGCSILASLSQLIPLKHLYGDFNHGELLLIMLNDSYTGYFTFPFLLSFFLMVLTPKEQNIFFLLTRYRSRREYIRARHSSVIKNVLFYFGSICLFSIIAGIGSSKFGIGISDATKEYAKIYLLGEFTSNNLIWEIVKIITLQGLLLYFFTMVHLVLNQLNISQVIVFIIYAIVLFLNAGAALGFFGNMLEPFSVFSLAGSIYKYGLGFWLRVLILSAVDMLLLILYFGIFEKKDIVMPKGSKEYQNE